MYIQKSYLDHENHIKNIFNNQLEERLLPHKLSEEENFHILEPLYNLVPFFNAQNSWLTIGDYIGIEASFLLKRNQIVTASDISDVFLKEVKNLSIITDYLKLNAEKIDCLDNSFDYVICKEMLHHLPRPYLAIYEMIRVSKKAVIAACEPIDILSKISLLVFIKNVLDSFNPLLINKIWKNRFSYESFLDNNPINYVYKFSEREIEKIAAAIKLPMVAFKSFNYNVGKLHRLLSKIRILPKGQLSFIFFKQNPERKLLEDLKKKGYRILELPQYQSK